MNDVTPRRINNNLQTRQNVHSAAPSQISEWNILSFEIPQNYVSDFVNTERFSCLICGRVRRFIARYFLFLNIVCVIVSTANHRVALGDRPWLTQYWIKFELQKNLKAWSQLQFDTFYIPRGQGGLQFHFLKYTMKGLFLKNTARTRLSLADSTVKGSPQVEPAFACIFGYFVIWFKSVLVLFVS